MRSEPRRELNRSNILHNNELVDKSVASRDAKPHKFEAGGKGGNELRYVRHVICV